MNFVSCLDGYFLTNLMLHPERFGYHPDLMHMVIVACHFMRFEFQDDNQQVGIGIHRTLAVYQMGLIAGSFELT